MKHLGVATYIMILFVPLHRLIHFVRLYEKENRLFVYVNRVTTSSKLSLSLTQTHTHTNTQTKTHTLLTCFTYAQKEEGRQ